MSARGWRGAPRGVASSIASATTATTSTPRRTMNCVRASTAKPIATSASRSVRHVFARHRVCQRQECPAEGRIGNDLGEQERRERDPGNGHAQRARPEREQPPEPDPAREQKDRDRGGGDQKRVQPMRPREARGDVAVAEQRRDQHRVELVDVRDELPVQPRQQRAGLRDRDRQPLVVELVGHHEPVLHPRRREGENPAEEECDGDHRGAVDEGTRPHRRPR